MKQIEPLMPTFKILVQTAQVKGVRLPQSLPGSEIRRAKDAMQYR